MNAMQIAQAWLAVFPNGHVRYSKAALTEGEFFINFYLQQPEQWANGISNNDPLSYMVRFDGADMEETGCSLLIKPALGSYMAYGSVKLRKQTIKGVDEKKLIKRFQRVRDMVEAEAKAGHLAHEVKLS